MTKLGWLELNGGRAGCTRSPCLHVLAAFKIAWAGRILAKLGASPAYEDNFPMARIRPPAS